MDLKGLSAVALRDLATKASKLATDLEREQPTVALAIEYGIKDRTYHTVAAGWVASYEGETHITMADGTTWKAIGHKPRGGADWLDREGYVEFIKIED